MKQFILPKGIKRNFEEGSELLEYMDNLDDDEDQRNSSDKSDEEIYESDADEKELTNEEMNESHRARKILQKVQKLDLLLT